MKRADQSYCEYIDIAGVILVVIDAGQRVSFINKKGSDILGYSKDQIIGKNWFENFVPEKIRDEVADTFNKIISGKIEVGEYFENPVLTASGEERLISWHNSVIRDQKGKIISSLSSGEDITERKKAENELKTLKEDLETEVMKKSKDLLDARDKTAKAERLAVLGKLAGIVAHELRTPLAVIKNSVYYLKNNLQRLISEGKLIHQLDVIDSEVNASDRIIEDILTFAKIKEPELKICRVKRFLEKSSKMVKKPDDVELVIETEEGLPDVMVDESQMTLVFSNIFLNAVQSMPDGGRVKVKGYKENDLLKIAVSDTGVGIPAANMNKIFDVLFTTKIRGTGLGLSVCQSIVNMHGGNIEVKSEENSGTTFTVTLPLN